MTVGIAQHATRPTGPRRLLNASWPPNPRAVDAAPTRVPCVVHLVWEDGPEDVEGHAIRWSGTHVFVTLCHPRVRPVQGVWVDGRDVSRRAPDVGALDGRARKAPPACQPGEFGPCRSEVAADIAP